MEYKKGKKKSLKRRKGKLVSYSVHPFQHRKRKKSKSKCETNGADGSGLAVKMTAEKTIREHINNIKKKE